MILCAFYQTVTLIYLFMNTAFVVKPDPQPSFCVIRYTGDRIAMSLSKATPLFLTNLR